MKKGFTLIELLVVVLIIGILSSIALPQYTVAVEKSRAAEIWEMVHNINQAWELQNMADPSSLSTVKPQDIMEFSGGKWSSDGKRYCTKNFTYDMRWSDTNIYRCTPKSDCSGCTSGTIIYEFPNMRTRLSEDYDEPVTCWYKSETGPGKKICNSFKGIINVNPVLDD